MKNALLMLFAFTFSSPALASGDAAKGEAEFKKCKACHSIIKEDGTNIVKGGMVGPNLFGVIGRKAGSAPDFTYGPSDLAAGQAGLVWDETNIVEYLANPTAFLQKFLNDPAAKSKMTFKLAKGGEDIAAYLSSVAK